jgi:hypothetical protein
MANVFLSLPEEPLPLKVVNSKGAPTAPRDTNGSLRLSADGATGSVRIAAVLVRSSATDPRAARACPGAVDHGPRPDKTGRVRFTGWGSSWNPPALSSPALRLPSPGASLDTTGS